MRFQDELGRLAQDAGVGLSDRVVSACAEHYRLLCTWNRTHNLTRVVEEEAAVRAHYLDCLLPLFAWGPPRSFVDVGAGAGFPGLLAALVWQGTRGTLVEPSRKRASFLEVAKAAMGLLEVEIRAPSGDISAERVLSRATFSAGRRGKLVGYALSAGSVGVWGHHHDVPTWNSEVATWGWQPDKPLGYRVPGLEERCILRASAVRGA